MKINTFSFITFFFFHSIYSMQLSDQHPNQKVLSELNIILEETGKKLLQLNSKKSTHQKNKKNDNNFFGEVGNALDAVSPQQVPKTPKELFEEKERLLGALIKIYEIGPQAQPYNNIGISFSQSTQTIITAIIEIGNCLDARQHPTIQAFNAIPYIEDIAQHRLLQPRLTSISSIGFINKFGNDGKTYSEFENACIKINKIVTSFPIPKGVKAPAFDLTLWQIDSSASEKNAIHAVNSTFPEGTQVLQELRSECLEIIQKKYGPQKKQALLNRKKNAYDNLLQSINSIETLNGNLDAFRDNINKEFPEEIEDLKELREKLFKALEEKQEKLDAQQQSKNQHLNNAQNKALEGFAAAKKKKEREEAWLLFKKRCAFVIRIGLPIILFIYLWRTHRTIQ